MKLPASSFVVWSSLLHSTAPLGGRIRFLELSVVPPSREGLAGSSLRLRSKSE